MARSPTPSDEKPAGYVKVDLGKDPMSIWNNLRTPDPRRTKTFKRAGGFTGTAITPLHIAERLTQIFGPCGLGWGFQVNQIDYVPAEAPEVVYVLVTLWWKLDGVTNKGEVGRAEIQHVGGTMLKKGGKDGPARYDDEAVKAAVTDAIGKAATYIGAAADVYLGLFDDNKYVKDAQELFTSSTGTTAPAAPEGENEAEKKANIEAEVEVWKANILKQIDALKDEDESMVLLKGIRTGALAVLEKLGDHPAAAAVKEAIVKKRQAISDAG